MDKDCSSTPKGFADGGEVEDDDLCPTCGAPMPADDFDGDEPTQQDPAEEETRRRAFAEAIRRRR